MHNHPEDGNSMLLRESEKIVYAICCNIQQQHETLETINGSSGFVFQLIINKWEVVNEVG
jgi:hypothetical protein